LPVKEVEGMNNRFMLLLGAGAGALTMYYFDPARGRYRRAVMRDQLVHAGHKLQHGVGVVGRDARNRTAGTLAVLRTSIDSTQPEDRVLAERVRACLGRVVSHPASVHVEAKDGRITLTGPVLEKEVPMLIECVRHVRGVAEVSDRLEVHRAPGRVPGLQGTPRPKRGPRWEFGQTNWSPAARAAAGLVGATATLYGIRRRGVGRGLVRTGGLLLLGRALTNLDARRLLGIGAPPHRAVDVQKTLRIQAPVEQVFHLWDHVENFPAIMTHVRRVRRLPEQRDDASRWRWRVRTRAGMQFEFDTVLTGRKENRLLAWRTEPGSSIQHAGRVQFLTNSDGSTTVDLKMVYNPVAGFFGHAIAWLIGADPKQQLDDDLMRMKTFLETGKPPRDAAQRRSDVSDILLKHEERRMAAGAGTRGIGARQS
jgi:uncharacterized membrane protein